MPTNAPEDTDDGPGAATLETGEDAFQLRLEDTPAAERVAGRYVQRWTNDPRFLKHALARGAPYLPEIRRILRAAGVPEEFAYLPIVESGFRTHAVSPARAVGPWQFLRATARRYGLRIDRWVDERRDPVRAAEAAAQYLRDLHDLFGDWLLALAAYNAGERRVQSLLAAGEGDFWSIRHRLPRETRHYVPRFLAALEVLRRLDLLPPASEAAGTAELDVRGPVPLDVLAAVARLDHDRLRRLNPALRRGVVPPEGWRLRVPILRAAAIAAAWDNLDRLDSGQRHTVRRGETPAAIARRYDADVYLLMRLNGIRDPRRLRTGTVLRIPLSEAAVRRAGGSITLAQETSGGPPEARLP